jgi:Predicted nucleotide-binding protein containing TIR-like domain
VAQLRVEAVILHEQPGGDRPIIVKFSECAKESAVALVLLTADDVGAAGIMESYADLRSRARQNVVFKLGFFFGSLGRERVCAVYAPEVEMPSDLKWNCFCAVWRGGLEIGSRKGDPTRGLRRRSGQSFNRSEYSLHKARLHRATVTERLPR